jgi:phage I-like protein
MDPKLVQAAFDALMADDQEACKEILKNLLASAVTGEAAAPPAADAGATAENADVPPPAADAPPADEKPAQMAALSRELVTLSGRTDPGEALAYFRTLHAAAAQTQTDAVALEAGERRGLVATLVTLGVEVPALAWVDVDAVGAARAPCKRLADEPIDELRTRVVALSKARGARSPAAPHTPPATAPVVVTLSKAERAYCEREKITPEEFSARKASAVKRSK